MKPLYLSDLDGTLLKSDETLSAFTCRAIERLAEQGMLFSYATARSYNTAKKVTAPLGAVELPLIVYNGAFIRENKSGRILLSNYFENGAEKIIAELLANDIYPIVYSYIGGAERFSYLYEKCTQGARDFIKSRAGDSRDNPVRSEEQLYRGEVFYLTCIDSAEKLYPVYQKFRSEYRCLYQRDFYTGGQWLEIMPSGATKANAALRLKELLGCDRLVAFGDSENDADLFAAADACYAVENAVPVLKAAATGVIGSNDDDGVAKWLLKHFCAEQKAEGKF